MADKDDNKPEPISKMQDILDKAWNETMGEDRTEIPDEHHHLDDVIPEKPAKAAEPSTPPAADPGTPPPAEPAVEPPAGDSREAPQHWSAEDRATFAKLDEAGQAFLLRRHREMEGDYTRKTQEHAETVKYGKAFRDYMDSGVKNVLAGTGVTEEQFLGHLLAYHRLSMVNPEEFVRQTVRNLNVDPAKLFNLQQPAGEPGKPAATPAPEDPTTQRIAALEQRISSEDQARQAEMAANAKSSMEQFRDEKDPAGNPLRPHFEKVRAMMGRLMMADPTLDMAQAYDVAVYRDPELRGTTPPPAAAQPNPPAANGQLNERKVKEAEQALAAKRSNIRSGSGAGVEKTGKLDKDGKPKKVSIRDALNDAADEVGFN